MSELYHSGITVLQLWMSDYVDTGNKILDTSVVAFAILLFTHVGWMGLDVWYRLYNRIIYWWYGMKERPYELDKAPYFIFYPKDTQTLWMTHTSRQWCWTLPAPSEPSTSVENEPYIWKSAYVGILSELFIRNNICPKSYSTRQDQEHDNINIHSVRVNRNGIFSEYLYPLFITSTGSICYFCLVYYEFDDSDQISIYVPVDTSISECRNSIHRLVDYLRGIHLQKKLKRDKRCVKVPFFKQSSQGEEDNSYDRGGETYKTLGYISEKKTFDTLFYEQKDQLVSLLSKFRNKTLYPTHVPIDNKLGILLYGPPGTGKTGTIHAIANFLDRNIVVINFGTIKTTQQLDDIMDYREFENNVYVFDEIDYILDECLSDKHTTVEDEDSTSPIVPIIMMSGNDNSSKHKNQLMDRLSKGILGHGSVKESTPITLSYLLHKLDGLECSHDRCIVATTNNVDRIPPALLRPGRFDIKLCLSNCSVKMYRQIISHYYSDDPTIQTRLESFPFRHGQHSPLEVINMAIQSNGIDELLSRIRNTWDEFDDMDEDP